MRINPIFQIIMVGASLSAAFASEPEKLTLVERGQSFYHIVVDSSTTENDLRAAQILQQYIAKVSGAQIPIENVAGTDSDDEIWIGSAEHPEKCPIPVDWQKLEEDGFTIKSEGRRLVIAGGSDKGSIYGVYTFLETCLGCRKFSPEVEIIPKNPTILLSPLEITQVPVFKFRKQNFWEPSYCEWHGLDTHENEWGLFVHTFHVFISPEVYFKDHPEYFSLVNGIRVPDGQLCLTNPNVFRIIIEELRRRMQANPKARYWSVSQNDTWNACECQNCRALNDPEGSPIGSLIWFVNRVAEQFPDKIISTLAYTYSRSAPRTICPRSNVNIMLCSIECNRSKPLANDPGCASFVEDVRNWTALTHNILLWDYVVQFRNYLDPFPNLRVLQPNLQFFARQGITSVFEQGMSTLHGEMGELRTYLIAKLLWNPDLNVDSVMNDFLAGYYGNAAPVVREYIDTLHDALATSGENLDIYGYPYSSENGYLSPKNLDAYNAIFNRAEAAVATQPECLERVQTARLPVQYALLEQAKVFGTAPRGFFLETKPGTWTVRPKMEALLDTFVVRCQRAHIEAMWEGGTPPEEYQTESLRYLTQSMQPHLAMFKEVTLAQPASFKYHHGEKEALTDGLRGWNDYHMNWLGFEGEDVEATVDLGKVLKIHSLSADFLQDINSWVFMPLAVNYSVSKDGRTFHPVANLKTTSPADKGGAFTETFRAELKNVKARYVRVQAVNIKTCPIWHKGAGGLAWIFTDEIVVQ
jgi:hypothetical protein